jgi:hypothetical protein
MTSKMKEASKFLENLKTPTGKSKSLRDQLAALEKLTADIHVNKSKLELAFEKLEVRLLFRPFYGISPNC